LFSATPASGLAVSESSHDVFVADTGNHRISVFTEAGTFVRAFGFGVADGKAELESCTASCQAGVSGSQPGELSEPVFVAVDNSQGPSRGDVYVGDAGDGLVSKFTEAGVLVGSWGNNGPSEAPDGQLKGSAAAAFGALSGIAVPVNTGDLVVITAAEDSQMFTFDDAGVFRAQVDLGASLGFSFFPLQPIGLAFDANDDFYAALFNATSNSLERYEPSGPGFNRTVPTEPSPEATGFAFDPVGEGLYVDHRGSVIQHYGLDGAGHVFQADGSLCPLTDAGCAPSDSFGVGQIEGEGGAGVAVDSSDEAVYVADTAAQRVDLFSLVGPLPLTLPATNVGGVTATLNGHVASTGGNEVTDCRFEIVDAASYQAGAPDPYAAGRTVPCSLSVPFTGQVPVSAQVPELSLGTEYHYRVSASDAKGTNVGSDQHFFTRGPIVGGEFSALVSATAADLHGEINPNGDPVSYHFEYLTEAAYQADGEAFTGPEEPALAPVPDGAVAAGEASQSLPATHITGLAASTAYRYRLLASSHCEPGEPAKTCVVAGAVIAFSTQGPGGPLVLPDNRGWELVSPPDKHGALILPMAELEGRAVQASAAGDALTYGATAPTEGEPPGNGQTTQVLSLHTASGWGSQDISVPHIAPTTLTEQTEYQFFSEDLSLAVVQPLGPFNPALSPEASEQTAYLRTNFLHGNVSEPCTSSCYRPLVTGAEGVANVPEGTEFGICEALKNQLGASSCHQLKTKLCPPAQSCGPRFVSPSPDVRQVQLSSSVDLAGAGGKAPFQVIWADGKLRAASSFVLPAAEGGGVAEGFLVAGPADYGDLYSREGHLYLQGPGGEGSMRLDGTEAGPGQATLLYAPADGSVVFFSDPQQLTGAPGGGVYACWVTAGACRLELTGLSWTGFVGGTARGADPYLYFEDAGHNLTVAHYDGHEWATTHGPFIGPQATAPHEENGLTTFRFSPDGRWFAFASDEPLTGYDNHDAVSGRPDVEVFLYDAASDKLVCASCNPTGARPRGLAYSSGWERGPTGTISLWLGQQWVAALLPGATTPFYQSRYLSDGGRLFFDSSDALVPQDTNKTVDVYQYEPPVGEGAPPGDTCTPAAATYSPASGGCASLISSGTANEQAGFLDASQSGGDVFFLTTGQLSKKRDHDSSFDVYDARVGGGEPEPVEPVVCLGDGCAGSVSPPPPLALSTLTLASSGNFTPFAPPPPKHKTAADIRHEKLLKALMACKRDKKKTKRLRCEKTAHKDYGVKTKAKRASSNRRQNP
jgi:DNA-binding beta-propeller fold protein YncE